VTETQKPGSGRRHIDTRAVVNALLYRLRTGCQWHLLPREYPKWQIVSHHLGQWSANGTVEQVQAVLHRLRQRLGYAGLQDLWPKRQRRDAIPVGRLTPAMTR